MTEEVIKSGTFRIKLQDEGNEEVVTSWRLDLLPRKKGFLLLLTIFLSSWLKRTDTP
jgi:hypothetical protein